MARRLAPFRDGVDIVPSHDPERPGLVIFDRDGFSAHQIVVPPALIAGLACFDGQHDFSALDPEYGEHLESALSQCGFLLDDNFARQRETRLQEWQQAEVVDARHFGPGNYPPNKEDAENTFNLWMKESPGREVPCRLVGIAAPHASPEPTRQSYVAAYGSLLDALPREAGSEKTFVILGTSHYGPPDALGLTRKSFRTPFGEATVDRDLLAALLKHGGSGMTEDDYYFSVEHSIEFQVVWLQYLYGKNMKILPILSGAFASSMRSGQRPEAVEGVRRALGALGEINASQSGKLVWVLGVDLAHVGKRYGDPFRARANRIDDVEQRDRNRLAAICRGDMESYWEQVLERSDDIKWCGASGLYAFIRAVPEARGTLLDYRHWQIDAESVVTVAGLTFHNP